jgi:hypothetical protein
MFNMFGFGKEKKVPTETGAFGVEIKRKALKGEAQALAVRRQELQRTLAIGSQESLAYGASKDGRGGMQGMRTERAELAAIEKRLADLKAEFEKVKAPQQTFGKRG